ncbi:PssD/Cps14F family polysaccharide biosynthesis glycosyltransferase [Chloroflexota bacterium]
MKICLACSHGGHLTEMQRLMPAFDGKEYFFVTHKSEYSRHLERAYFIEYKEGYVRERVTWLKTIFIALRIMLKERPDVVISTGGGEIAVPFCYVGKLLGAKVILIETLTRITTKSAAGRLIYPIADLFLVQWESLLKRYGKKAHYWGNVI